MDLRFRPQARTTKDVDLAVPLASFGPATDLPAALRERLQDAVAVDLGDYLTYRIGEPRHELTNAPAGGARYPCAAVLVGKPYARFHLDVGCGDARTGAPEALTGIAHRGLATRRRPSPVGARVRRRRHGHAAGRVGRLGR